MTRSPEVYEATKEYVIAALRYLEEHHSSGPTLVLETDRWVRTAPGQFACESFTQETWAPSFGGIEEQVHGLPEYEACVAALRGDEVIRPQLESIVGTAVGSISAELRPSPMGLDRPRH